MVSAILPLAREAIVCSICDHVEHDGESLFSSRLGARPPRNCGETEIRSLFTFTERIAGESWGASNFQGRGVTLLPSLYHLMRPFPVQQKSQDHGRHSSSASPQSLENVDRACFVVGHKSTVV